MSGKSKFVSCMFWVAILFLTVAVTSCAGGSNGNGNLADDDGATFRPEAPGDLTATGQEEDIRLSWADNSNNEDGFYVYRRPGGSSEAFELVAELESDVTEYIDSELGAEKDYEYEVTAFNSAGESEPSNIARAQTIPNAPSDLLVHDVKKYRATLSWEDSSDIESGYKVERRTESGDWEEIATLPADACVTNAEVG